MIDPEDILDILEPLKEAMELSYKTYATMLSSLGPAHNLNGELYSVERVRDDLHYSYETIDKLDPGKHRNIVALHFLQDLANLNTDIEKKKVKIVSELPDFADIEARIKHENRVLMSSEETLKMMIDNFSPDSKNLRLYKNYLNDRINLNTSMSQMLPPQDYSTQWNKLSKDLGSAEDIQMRHEDLKRGLLSSMGDSSMKESPALVGLLQTSNTLLDSSEKLIEQMKPSSESQKKFLALKDKRKSINVEFTSRMDKLKGLMDILQEYDAIKEDNVTMVDFLDAEPMTMLEMGPKRRKGASKSGLPVKSQPIITVNIPDSSLKLLEALDRLLKSADDLVTAAASGGDPAAMQSAIKLHEKSMTVGVKHQDDGPEKQAEAKEKLIIEIISFAITQAVEDEDALRTAISLNNQFNERQQTDEDNMIKIKEKLGDMSKLTTEAEETIIPDKPSINQVMT